MPELTGGLELSLSAPAAALSGEALRLRASLRNEGPRPFETRLGPGSPMAYAFRALDGARAFERSGPEALRNAIGDRAAPLPEPERTVVAPGASLDYDDDAAALAPEPIPPGRYEVVARLRLDAGFEVASPPVVVAVAPAAPSLFTQAFCPLTGDHAQAFDHADAAGDRWLLHRDTLGERAEAGAFQRRAKLPGAGPVTGLAVAVHASSRLDGRWVAWLRDGRLGALAGWGGDTVARPAPAPVALADAVLVEPGFQFEAPDASDSICDHGAGLFLVVGEHGGRAWLQTFRAAAQGITANPPTPLDATQIPRLVRATWRPETRTITVVWAEEFDAGTALYARDYAPNGAALAAAPRGLYQRASPLAALALAPYADAPARHVHALFGPEGHVPLHYWMCFSRVDLDGAAPEELGLPVVDAASVEHAVAAHDAGDLVALAATPTAVLAASARDGRGWRALATDATRPTHLAAASSTRRYWAALWADAASGIRCAPDPDYSRER